MSSCKLPDAPQDVSPKSVSSFTDTPSLMESIPIFKSHKRQRSDAMVEKSPAHDSFLVRQHGYVANSQQVLERVDTEDVCKPRAVYPINFKAPKMYSSPQSRRSRDLEIPGGGGSASEWNQLRSPSDPSVLANFNVGFFNKESFHTNNTVGDHRRLSKHRSRSNSYNNSGMHEAVDALSEDGDQSQISIDLERISLAATSFSPFTPPRPTLRPSPLLPVVFSPIQHLAYRKFDTVVAGRAEGFSVVEEQDEEEEDQELVVNLPKDEIDDASTTCGSAAHTQSSHIHQHDQQQHLHNPYHHISSVHIVTSTNNTAIPLATYNAAHTIHDIHHYDPAFVEGPELLDEDLLIFNMDV